MNVDVRKGQEAERMINSINDDDMMTEVIRQLTIV